jgi:hypothetical protein
MATGVTSVCRRNAAVGEAGPDTVAVAVASWSLEGRMHVAVEGAGPTTFHFGPPTPETPLQITLVRHGKTGVEWFATGSAAIGTDRATLSISLDASILDSGDCIEVSAQDDRGGALELEEVFFTHGSDGWQCTPERPAELRAVRAAYFAQPLIAPNAWTAARSFRAVAVIEGLLLTQNTRVPGIDIYALQQPLRTEEETVGYLSQLSLELFGSMFLTGAHSDRGLPCVAVKFGDIRADTPDLAMSCAHESASRMSDLLGFNRSARPELIAVAVLENDDSGSVRIWVDPRRTQYTGNLVGGFIAGESTDDLILQWNRTQTDPRVSLWLSQVNDARAERRWEYRVFRYFNLLEGMSKGSIGVKANALDARGQQLLQSNGQPYTTKEARAAVYMVIAGLSRFRGDISEDAFCPYATLWELCQHWTTVRNQVAHAGAWDSHFKVSGTSLVEAFLNVAPQERRADLESILEQCVRFVVDGVIFRGYLPL